MIGNSYRNETYEQLNFRGRLDDGTSNAFTRCVFRNVTFTCDSDDYIVFYNCTFEGRLRFEGAMPHMFFVADVNTGEYTYDCVETGNQTMVPFVATTDSEYAEWNKRDWINLLQGPVASRAYSLIFKNLIHTENVDDPVPETEEE